MYHSITFGDGTLTPEGKFAGMNTWDDWYLIPSKRPTVAIPPAVISMEDVPGKNGSSDMTDNLIGRPYFQDRSGSFEFYTQNEKTIWSDLKNRIATFIHGQKMKMCLEDDPDYYFEGRFSVESFQSEKTWSIVTISYRLNPYKYHILTHERVPIY